MAETNIPRVTVHMVKQLPGRRVKPLTPGKVQKVNQPGRYADGAGLYLLVKPDGRKSWVFRWQDRVTGKNREAGLGSLAQRVNLKMARARADLYRDMVWNGLDPIEEKRKQLEEAREAAASCLTFKDCMTRYIDAHKAGWRNDKHTAQWSSTLETYAEPILNRAVAEITDQHVLRCLEPIWTEKTETATRVRQRIEAVLDWATARKYRKGDNPARWKGHLDKLLPKPTSLKKVKHRAALPYAEIGAFMAELREKKALAARALELQILTASRPGEAVAAKWEEFDLVAKLWTIPGGRMKAHKTHEIPLSDKAVSLLKSLPRVAGTDYLFPGLRDSHITTAAGMKLLKGLREGVTAHGFRSTFRDWAADQTAYPREVIEQALAHQLKDKAEAAYFRSTMLPKRARLMQAWSDYCDAIPGKSAKVTAIRKA